MLVISIRMWAKTVVSKMVCLSFKKVNKDEQLFLVECLYIYI